MDLSETIAACDLKVGHGHFFTLAKGHLHMKIKICFSQEPMGHFKPNFVCKLLGTWK